MIGRAAAAVVLVLCACAGPFLRPSGERVEGPLDHLSAAERIELARARSLEAADDRSGALEIAQSLAVRLPDNLPVGIYVQELELRGTDEPLAVVQERLRAALEASLGPEPSLTRLLLLARLEENLARRRTHLERALALDGEAAWTHYALAHLEAQSGRWAESRVAFERALELDPFHPGARLLQARFLARNGRLEEALDAFDAWLEDTRGDARIDPLDRLGARLDWATLQVLSDEPDEARRILDDLPPSENEGLRALCIRAANAHASGDSAAALDLAQRAAEVDPDATLPWIQQALLFERELAQPARSRAAWVHLLELAEASGDLGALLLAMRARVILERGAPAEGQP